MRQIYSGQNQHRREKIRRAVLNEFRQKDAKRNRGEREKNYPEIRREKCAPVNVAEKIHAQRNYRGGQNCEREEKQSRNYARKKQGERGTRKRHVERAIFHVQAKRRNEDARDIRHQKEESGQGRAALSFDEKLSCEKKSCGAECAENHRGYIIERIYGVGK